MERGEFPYSVISNLASDFIRFFVNRPIRKLAQAAFERLTIANDGSMACLLFPTVTFARDCARYIAKEHPEVTVEIVQFRSPGDRNESVARVLSFAGFAMAVFPNEVKRSAMMFWSYVGGGLTTRHASFAIDYLDYLEATSSNKRIEIVPPKPVSSLSTPSWVLDVDATAMHVRSTIAKLSTPESPSLPAITAEHVALYPTGMSAITHASEAIQAVAATSTVVAFGCGS